MTKKRNKNSREDIVAAPTATRNGADCYLPWDHGEQDLYIIHENLYTRYFPMFTNNVWFYLLWSPVILIDSDRESYCFRHRNPSGLP